MRRWMVLLALLVVGGTVVGRVAWQRWQGQRVRLAEVTTGRVVEAVYATGRVDTDRRVTLRARLAAPLAEVLVGPGEAVAAGQVVARQEAAVARLPREKAEREVEAARAALTEAEDAAVRAERLAQEALLPEDAWVRAREQAREQRAVLASRESALALAREQEGWATLRAPLGGVVGALLRRAGDPLREGDEVLTIVDLSAAYVRVAVDERDLGRVAIGQDVRMVFDAYPDRVLHGSVWRLVPALDRLTKSSDVLVGLPAERPPLHLDLTVTVNVVTGVVDGAVTIPREALQGAGAERTALLPGPRGRAESRAVRVGACDEARCQVLSGLAPGERVISPLPSGLRAGDRVSVE